MIRNFLVNAILILMFTGICIAGEKAPPEIYDFANTTLAAFGSDPVIVAAVKQENAKNKSLDTIKKMDSEWKAHAGIADYMQAMMDSECGKHLRAIQGSKAFYSEIFVMDNQGGNVAMTDKTSDYWQGDEAKFQKSFAGGKGSVFVDEVEFDDSSQAYLVQISIPVMDGGQAIGAMTIGIDIDQFETGQ